MQTSEVDTNANVIRWSVHVFAGFKNQWVATPFIVPVRNRFRCTPTNPDSTTEMGWRSGGTVVNNNNLVQALSGSTVERFCSIVLQIKSPNLDDDVTIVWDVFVVSEGVYVTTPWLIPRYLDCFVGIPAQEPIFVGVEA